MRLTATVLALLVLVACRPHADVNEKDAGAGTTPSASASAAKRGLPDIDPEEEEAYFRALCALASLPRPPRADGNHSWDTALLETKSKKKLGWVQMFGEAATKDDASWFASSVDSQRFNMNAGIYPCQRYRADPERRTLITAIVRHSGDARKGDYRLVVALGTGPDNPRATSRDVAAVDEIGARLAALEIARTLVGESFDSRHITVDDWKTALTKLNGAP